MGRDPPETGRDKDFTPLPAHFEISMDNNTSTLHVLETDGEKDSTPLPALEIACLCAVFFSEALQMNVLFPFLVFMVESYGFTGSELGLAAGILASSFAAAQFLSSMLWGYFSDRVGLKPCLVLGTFGSSLCMLMFGLSRRYVLALLIRFCGGLLNGNIGLVKSFMGKITDGSNRSKAYSFIAVADG